MKARTRSLYLVLIGAAAVAAWQECGGLPGPVCTRSVAYAQTLSPAVSPEVAPPPALAGDSAPVIPLPPDPADIVPAPLATDIEPPVAVSAAKTLKKIDV